MLRSPHNLLPKDRPPRILIVRLSSVGDVVHALPVLTGLRKCFPNAYLAWIVEEKARQVVEHHPLLNEVIVFEKARWKETVKQQGMLHSLGELRDLAQLLKSRKFDIAIDLQRLLRSGLITFFSGARIRLGFADAREHSHVFYNVKIPVPQRIHAIDRYFLAVKFFKDNGLKPEFSFPLRAEEEYSAQQFLAAHQLLNSFLVGIFPTASLPHKCWNIERFALLADTLSANYRAKILLFAGKHEEEAAQEMAHRMAQKPTLIPSHADLRTMAALIARCRLFVSNDTGPLHIAVALQIPVVGLYGPFDPHSTGPYGEKSIILYHQFPCAPCIRHPICQNFDCMKSISVDEALQAVRTLLQKESSSLLRQP